MTVVHTGDAFATGINGVAALFESEAKDGMADITAMLNGNFRGGSVLGKGVFLDGGVNNLLTINGSASAVSGNAIVGTTGNDTVANNGLVIGNVDLDGRTSSRAAQASANEINRFDNNAAGVFLASDRVSLGTGGTLSNDGVLAPGDNYKLQTTALTGSFTQSASGNFETDLDFGRSVFNPGGQFTDRVNATESAQIGGTVTTVVQNVPQIRAGERDSVLVATGSGTAAGVPTLVAPTSAIASFGLVNDGRRLSLTTKVDFAGVGRTFNVNRTAVGDYFNSVQNQGSTAALAPVITQIFFTPTTAGLGQLYDSYMGELYADQLAGAVYASDRFADAAVSCARNGVVTANGCSWLEIGGDRLRLGDTFQNHTVRERGGFVRGGTDHRLGASNLYAGFALGVEDVNSRVNGDSAAGQRYQGALGFYYRGDALGVSLVGTFGSGSANALRTVLTPVGPAATTGKQEYTFGSVAVDAGYRLAFGSLWLRPSMEALWTWYDQQHFIETGAGALSLSVAGSGGNVYRLTTSVELVGTTSLGGRTTLTASVKAGYTRMFDPSVAIHSSFVGAAPIADTFATRAFLDRDYANVKAGLTLKTAGGIAFRLGYEGSYGRRTRDHAASAKLSVPF